MGTTLPLPLPGVGGLIVLIPVVIVGVGIYIVLSSRLKVNIKDITKTKDPELTCPEVVHEELKGIKKKLLTAGIPPPALGIGNTT